MDVVHKMMKRLWKNASTILTCLAAGGLVATAVLTAQAAVSAKDACEQAKADKDGEDLTTLEAVTIAAKEYLPAVAVGAGTMICLFSANALSRRQQAALTSAYAALEGAYRGYREKVKQIMGPGTDHMVERAMEQEKQEFEDGDKPPWDAIQTFYLQYYLKDDKVPMFFESTMEQVLQAEYELNRSFVLGMSATLNEFLELLGLDLTPEGETIGWDQYIGEAHYGYRWIDFEHRHFKTDDGLTVCSIDMPFDPHPLNEEDDEEWLLGPVSTA